MKYSDPVIYYLKRRAVYIFAAAGVFASTINCLAVWFFAFFGKDYSVSVKVNMYNEAYPELVMIVFLIPCMIAGMQWLYHNWHQDLKSIRKYWYKRNGRSLPIDTL